VTILIYISLDDKASVNIKNRLMEKAEWEKETSLNGNPVYKNDLYLLFEGEERHIDQDGLDVELYRRGFDPNYIVFPSRHSSRNGEKLLSVHTPGNLGEKAEVGGSPHEISMSCPGLIKHSINRLRRLSRGTEYKTSLEATHHGPSDIDIPTMFIEVGSNEEEWKDRTAGEIIAETILSFKDFIVSDQQPVSGVSIGGGHYAPEQTRLLTDTNISIGHIMPKYALERKMIREMIKKTPGCSFIHISNDLEGEKDIINELDLPVYTEGDIRSLSPLNPAIWSEVIDRAPDGSKPRYMGDTSRNQLKLVELNQELISKAERTHSGREKIKSCIARAEAVCYERKNGTYTNRFLIPSKSFKDRIEKLINCAIKIISQEKPIEVSREGGHLNLEITQEKFNPEKALSLGIEKKQFGVLSGGGEVQIEGKTITPEMVHNINKEEINLKYPPKVLDHVGPG